MSKIGEMIQQTEQAIRETQDAVVQMNQQVAQMNQQIQAAVSHNNQLVARLQTLKEIEQAGSDVFTEAPAPESEEGQ